jgi:DNA-directed RNA polymerase specialized sigma24 family protein
MSGGKHRLARLREGLATLPDRPRQVYLLHARDGLSFDEIAVRLGLERADVAVLLASALGALSRFLDGPGP